MSALSGEAKRLELRAFVSSGAVDCCIETVVASVDHGTEGFPDTSNYVACMLLSTISKSRKQPAVEAKIRGVAKALEFWLENDLATLSEMGLSTASMAAQICESLHRRTILLREC